MGMQLSVEEANRRDSSSGETGARGQGAAMVRAHIAAIIHQLSESARHALERIKHAQARGGKRKQMRLIESLALETEDKFSSSPVTTSDTWSVSGRTAWEVFLPWIRRSDRGSVLREGRN